jgi:hypothetical protein
MAKITEEQLIGQIKMLKEIKPNQKWASLLKSQILAEAKAEEKIIAKPAEFAGFSNIFSSIFAQRKLAYSLAAVLILIVGAFGIARLLPFGTVSQKSTASLTVNQIAKLDPKVVADINSKIKNLTQTLKQNPGQTPQAIQGIAASLKTLSDVPGIDLTANPDAQDLYKTVVADQIIADQKTTLTEAQKKILADTVQLYNTGKYSDALEKILSIDNK